MAPPQGNPRPDSGDTVPLSARTKFLISFFSGGCTASVAKTAGAPLDRVKLLLQTQASNPTMTNPNRYTGMVDCFQKVVRRQGALSLWRGNGTNVLRYFPQQALGFAFKDTYKAIFLTGVDKKETPWKFFGANLAAGGAAGGTALIFVQPLEVARTRIATDVGAAGKRTYTGLGDCLQKTQKTFGYQGHYRAFGTSLATAIVYRGVFFGGFDMGMSILRETEHKDSLLATWAVAQCVTMTAGVVAYPLDTVRRLCMLDPDPIQGGSPLRTLKSVLTAEGVAGLYRGVFPNLLRSTGGAAVLVGVERLQAALHRSFELELE